MRTQRERMLAGELYDPFDPELAAARERARDLCRALNDTRESQAAERRRILEELFGAGGDSVWVQPPFYCDYGTNIRLGTRAFFNCVVLDVCEVKIGDHALFGPGALLLAGVRIGSRSVIGAGRVVTRDVPEGVLAAGNPCRVIRSLAP